MPRMRCTPALSVGVGIFVIASSLAGSGSTSICELVPHESDKRRFKLDFFADSRRSGLLHFSNRPVRF